MQQIQSYDEDDAGQNNKVFYEKTKLLHLFLLQQDKEWLNKDWRGCT